MMLSLAGYSQDNDAGRFVFYKYNKPKVKYLSRDKEITIYLNSINIKDSGLTVSRYITGDLVLKNDSVVMVNNANRNVEVYKLFNGGMDSYESESHQYMFYGDSIFKVNLRDIDHINYTQTIYDYCAFLTFLSATSALLLAPALSIDYSAWTLNSAHYFRILTPSLACFAVSFSCLFVFDHRELKVGVNVYPTPIIK